MQISQVDHSINFSYFLLENFTLPLNFIVHAL